MSQGIIFRHIIGFALALFVFSVFCATAFAHMPEADAEQKHGWNGVSADSQDQIYDRIRNVQEILHEKAVRHSGIADRMDSRATTLAQAGKDTSAAREYIEKARYSLTRAHAMLSKDAGVFVFESNPREHFADVRKDIESVHASIVEAHQHLQGALAILKDASAKETVPTSLALPPEIQ